MTKRITNILYALSIVILLCSTLSRALAEDSKFYTDLSPFSKLDQEFGGFSAKWKMPPSTNAFEDEGAVDAVSEFLLSTLYRLVKPQWIPCSDYVIENIRLYRHVVLEENAKFPSKMDIAVLPVLLGGRPFLITQHMGTVQITTVNDPAILTLDKESIKSQIKSISDKYLLIPVPFEKYKTVKVDNVDYAYFTLKNNPFLPEENDIYAGVTPHFISFTYYLYPDFFRRDTHEEDWLLGIKASPQVSYIQSWSDATNKQFQLAMTDMGETEQLKFDFTQGVSSIKNLGGVKIESVVDQMKNIFNPMLVLCADDIQKHGIVKITAKENKLRSTIMLPMQVPFEQDTSLPLILSEKDGQISVFTMLPNQIGNQNFHYTEKDGYDYGDASAVKVAFMQILKNLFRWVPDEKDVIVTKQETGAYHIEVKNSNGQYYALHDITFAKQGQYFSIHAENVDAN